jgi:hypothetical protein
MKIDDIPMAKGAFITPCKKFRYHLTRIWDSNKPKITVVGLNCSTADAEKNDPTVRREIMFAMDMGFGWLYKANLFAYRTKDPKKMKRARDPIGPDNDRWIAGMAKAAHKIVVAWGAHGSYLDRDRAVEKILRATGKPLWCFGVTKGGFPKHPLYLDSGTRLVEWKG